MSTTVYVDARRRTSPMAKSMSSCKEDAPVPRSAAGCRRGTHVLVDRAAWAATEPESRGEMRSRPGCRKGSAATRPARRSNAARVKTLRAVDDWGHEISDAIIVAKVVDGATSMVLSRISSKPRASQHHRCDR